MMAGTWTLAVHIGAANAGIIVEVIEVKRIVDNTIVVKIAFVIDVMKFFLVITIVNIDN